ncbi:acyltransferase [Flavobacterium taihuense]|uniref:Acyltransferase n=1 Tax=Flavobacterium taihuense TaxID=2857508 RepID=A0ABS6XUI7_9FLAO|nr:acyltransferase [Flavobacterium taihuense]MBW4360342.1 acyltransferase [Flavobacterium taihuense]
MKRIIIIYYVLVGLLKFNQRSYKIGIKLRIRGPVNLTVSDSGKLDIGDNFNLVSGLMQNPLGRNIKSFIRVDKEAEISIGDNVGMSCVTLWAKNSIQIGNNVKIGADVLVLDSDMHALDYQLRRSVATDEINCISKAVKIGDDVFIGTRSIICKGVEIGNRSIIGAGSVVVSNIPQDQIWGGNPAKFIKMIN